MVLRKKMRFLGKTKNFTKAAQFWSQNVQLVPIKKMNTHTLRFHPQIKELSALLRDQIAVQSRHLQWKDFQKYEPYAHRFCTCDSFFDYHPQGNSKKCHPHVYGNFVWEFQVRYNNQKSNPEEYDYQRKGDIFHSQVLYRTTTLSNSL